MPSKTGPADRVEMDEEFLLKFEKVEDVHWWFVVRRALVTECVKPWAPQPPAHIGSSGGGGVGG